jgi:hypothetical protein
VFHRLAPKRPARVEHELCRDCGCCTLTLDDPGHHYLADQNDWICWCPGQYREAGREVGVDGW